MLEELDPFQWEELQDAVAVRGIGERAADLRHARLAYVLSLAFAVATGTRPLDPEFIFKAMLPAEDLGEIDVPDDPLLAIAKMQAMAAM